MGCAASTAADDVLSDSDDDHLVEAELQQKLATAAQAESKRAAQSAKGDESSASKIQRRRATSQHGQSEESFFQTRSTEKR